LINARRDVRVAGESVIHALIVSLLAMPMLSVRGKPPGPRISAITIAGWRMCFVRFVD